MTKLRTLLSAALAIGLLGTSAEAGFHVMQVEEVVGSINGNTSAQAIQLRMRSSGQNLVSNARLWAWDAAGSNRILLLDIAADVSNSASGARILLATSAFTYTMIAGGSNTFTPDFTLANAIPASYLNAGRLTFEDDGGSPATPGTIYWSLTWGGASYTGSNLGNTQNDADGNFGPAFGGPLSNNSFAPGLIFNGPETDPSTSNSADYDVTSQSSTVTKNNGIAFSVVPEPGTAGLLAAGALALGGIAFARRRERSAV